MATDINWDNIEKAIIKNATQAINETLVKIQDEVNANTPIDTGDLAQNTKIRPAEIIGNNISGSVYNETEYGKYVEYGVQGKTYNYHKGKRIFFVGVGARMFTRAYDKMKPTIIKVLRKALNL